MAECITECYQTSFILHPFFGVIFIKNSPDYLCAVQYITNNSAIKRCDKNEPIFLNTLNCITPTIMLQDYLEYYYKLYSIIEVVEYINSNIHLKHSTINRLFYFTIVKYITTLQNNISNLINFVAVCLKRVYDMNITDKMDVSSALITVQSIYYDNKTNTINYLLLIKNILNDSI